MTSKQQALEQQGEQCLKGSPPNPAEMAQAAALMQMMQMMPNTSTSSQQNQYDMAQQMFAQQQLAAVMAWNPNMFGGRVILLNTCPSCV